MTNVAAQNAELLRLLQAKDYKNATILPLIKSLKIAIYTTNLTNQTQHFLTEARNFAEYNLFYSLAVSDLNEFSRAIEKVKFFYENFPRLKESSSNYYQIEAIQLLYLLSYNKIEDFYTKLECLSQQQLANNFIEYVVKLNEAIEEGNYRLVFSLKNSSPLEYFTPFLNRVSETVREEIARSSEKAYGSLSFKQALDIFQLPNERELREFCVAEGSKYETTNIKWKVKEDRIYFESTTAAKPSINSEHLIKTVLQYAHQLEKIV